MKAFIIIISILLTSLTYAQKNLLEKDDCIFNQEKIDSSNFDRIVNSLDTLIIGFEFPEKDYSKLLECLSSIDSSSPKLSWHKANYFSSKDLNDTSYLTYYRNCIKKDFLVAYSYYNIGVGYMDYMFSRTEKDSLRILEITEIEKTRLLKLAEKNMWLSYHNGLKDAVFVIGEIHKLKNENSKTGQPTLDLNHDTLTIVASILDCGEFGGHLETVDIIKKGSSSLVAIFHSDSIHCQNEITRPSDNSVYNGEQAIISKDIIIELINALDSYVDVGVISNAPFEIAVFNKKNVLYQRINLKWSHYLDFRMKTFEF